MLRINLATRKPPLINFEAVRDFIVRGHTYGLVARFVRLLLFIVFCCTVLFVAGILLGVAGWFITAGIEFAGKFFQLY